MKSKLFLWLTLSLLPAQLCATIVDAQVWQRPNGTHIVIFGDAHAEYPAEIQQAHQLQKYLLEHKDNLCVCSINFYQKPLCTGLVLETLANQTNHMPSYFDQSYVFKDIRLNVCQSARYMFPTIVSDLFTDKSFNQHEINLKLFAQTLLNDSEHITIPSSLQANYLEHRNTIANLLPSLPGELSLNHNDYKDQNASLATNNPTTLLEWFEDSNNKRIFGDLIYHGMKLFSIMLAAKLANESLACKNICIVSEQICLQNMQEPFTALGYNRIATFNPIHPDQLTAACNYLGSLKISSPYIKPKMTSLIHPTPNHAWHQDNLNDSTTMTPTEYRQWSNQYDKDMREESLPISGFGDN